MCLAVPGRVIEIFEEKGLKMGRIDYAGAIQKACLEFLPEVEAGEFVIVHAGFAISLLDQEEAVKSLETWDRMIEAASNEDAESTDDPVDGGRGRQ